MKWRAHADLQEELTYMELHARFAERQAVALSLGSAISARNATMNVALSSRPPLPYLSTRNASQPAALLANAPPAMQDAEVLNTVVSMDTCEQPLCLSAQVRGGGVGRRCCHN